MQLQYGIFVSSDMEWTNQSGLLIYRIIGDVFVKMASVLVVRLLAALFYGVSSFMITVANKVVLTSYK